jgi:hypothetical protein
MSECPYCDGDCIAFDDEENECYVKIAVDLPLKHQAMMAAEIKRLRGLLKVEDRVE